MALEIPAWMNIDFTQRVLRLAEDDSTIQVIDIFTKPATAKGDNYTSDMVRVTVEFTRKQGEQKVNDKISLIFKFEPLAVGARKEMIEKMELFDVEIAMMTDTLKKMNAMLGTRLSARVLHARMERPLCVIMEDLAPQGFRMADRQAGLDIEHCLLAIRGLAKFHASSVALCEKEPKLKDLYRKGMFNQDYAADLNTYFTKGCETLASEMEHWSEIDKTYGQKIKNLARHVYAKGQEAIARKDNEFNVINHGDCWVNNMLFRYDENNKPVEHIFVDFQLCIYTSPAIDLLYFLSTSVNVDVNDEERETLLEEYLRTLSSTMEQLECQTAPPTMSELKKHLEERAMYGLISTITILPVIVTDQSQAVDIDEIMSKDGEYNNPGFKSPIYRRIMCKRLPKYNELGLLD